MKDLEDYEKEKRMQTKKIFTEKKINNKFFTQEVLCKFATTKSRFEKEVDSRYNEGMAKIMELYDKRKFFLQ